MARGRLFERLRRIEKETGIKNRLKIIIAYSKENGTYMVDDQTLTDDQLDQHQKNYEEIYGSDNIFTIII